MMRALGFCSNSKPAILDGTLEDVALPPPPPRQGGGAQRTLRSDNERGLRRQHSLRGVRCVWRALQPYTEACDPRESKIP